MLTDQQHKIRLSGIGGSDMPVILGLSKYKTPYQLYLEKIGQTVNTEMTSAQYWGHRLEDVIRQEFAKRNNVIVEKPEETIRHPDYGCLIANLDGYIPSLNAVLEIKTSSQFMAADWGDANTDFIPFPYLAQVAHYCCVVNADCAYIAVLIGGNDYREYKYVRNIGIESKLITAAIRFWEHVQKRVPPPATNQNDLKLMFPRHNPQKTKIIKPDLESKLSNLKEIRFKIKKLNEMEEKYKFNIMEFMQDAECLTNQNGMPIISWKANKRGARTFLIKGLTQ